MEDKNVTLSVCMISYNHEKFIAQAIESVLMQKTIFNIELIIGEDYSTDGTRQICKDYAQKYPKIITLLSTERNLGVIPNFVRTLKACSGKFIAICEGDDYWIDPYKLQYQIESMQKYPSCNISIHPAYVLSNRKKKIKWNYSDIIEIFNVRDVLTKSGQFAPTSSYVFKSSVLQSFPKWFNSVPVGDFYLEALSSIQGGILFLPGKMSVYRANSPGSWVNEKKRNKSDVKTLNYFDQMEKYLGLLKNHLPIEYSKYVDVKISYTIYGKSLYYLANSNYKLFRKEIETSFLISKTTTTLARMLFFFRKLGPLARLIYLNKNIFN